MSNTADPPPAPRAIAGGNDERDPIMTTKMLIDSDWTDSGERPTVATCDPATGKVPERVPEAAAEDVDAAVRAANRAYWDHVAEVFGRRCSVNWTA